MDGSFGIALLLSAVAGLSTTLGSLLSIVLITGKLGFIIVIFISFW